jgi:hypothetical protein
MDRITGFNTIDRIGKDAGAHCPLHSSLPDPVHPADPVIPSITL